MSLHNRNCGALVKSAVQNNLEITKVELFLF